ncbi:MAG: ROK family protein [Deferribacteres bacterium]|nr:ROK family protein [candidate division KSB1 bacterium]MCB9501012.1 ROK family protein [Deferribacteres bacterium]
MVNTIIGLDIGGTKTAIVEGTFKGVILQRTEFPTEAKNPFQKTFPKIKSIINSIANHSVEQNRKIKAISVSIGGPLRIDEGSIINPPHLPGWHNLPLKNILKETYPRWPVYIEHDGNAGALAEFYFGAGKNIQGLQHLIFLTFGTGLGAGFIINGKILHGASDTAGEVGHWRLSANGPVGYGKQGSWEGFAAGTGLVNIAQELFPNKWPPNISIREIVDIILEENSEGKLIIEKAGEWMGKGIALLIDALNPQIIVLGSLGVVLGDKILKPIHDICQKESLPQAYNICQIVPAALGKKIGDIASLMAVISNENFR